MDAQNDTPAIGHMYRINGVFTDLDGLDPRALEGPVGNRRKRHPVQAGALLGGGQLRERAHLITSSSVFSSRSALSVLKGMGGRIFRMLS